MLSYPPCGAMFLLSSLKERTWASAEIFGSLDREQQQQQHRVCSAWSHQNVEGDVDGRRSIEAEAPVEG